VQAGQTRVGACSFRPGDLGVGGGKDGDHLAPVVAIVVDGLPGARCDDHGVTGPGDLGLAGDGDDALAGRDQQDLFGLVGVFGDRLTAGKDVSQHSHGFGAAGPVDKMLERRQSGQRRAPRLRRQPARLR